MTITFDQWRSVHPAFDHKGLSQTYVDTGNVEGENRPVILLFHGYPTWSYDWVDVIGPLSVGHRIIAADWIGYGLSDKPSRHVRVDEQINRLVALLDHLGVEDFHLVAHDYGSTCAQEMLDRPDIAARTKTLTLMNGGVIFSAYKPTQTQKLLISPLGSLVSRFLSKDRIKTKLDALRGQPMESVQFDNLWQGMSHQYGLQKAHITQRYILERQKHGPRWEAALERYPGPVQLIWGLLDPISGPHVLAPLRDLLPNAKVIELEDVGHFVPDEAPEEIVQALHSFIAEENTHG